MIFARRLHAAALALALFSAGGCAYYNTFYSARKAYENALEEKNKNPLDVATSTELGYYAQTIKSATNLLARYPHSKYVDDAVLLIGKAYLGRGDFELAVSQFQMLVDSLPKSPLVPDALLGKGEALSSLHRYAEAESSFVPALQRFPGFERKDELLLAWGDMKRDQRKSRDALEYYVRLARECPDSKLRYIARSRRGDAYAQISEWDSARVEFESVARDAPKAEDRFNAQLKVGDSYEGAGQFDRAISHYRVMQEDSRKLGREPEVLLRIAGAQASSGDYDKAIALYTRIKEDNVSNRFGSAAAYQLGYVYESYKEDFDKARQFYDAVHQLPRSEFTDLAEERNSGLKQAAQLKKQLEGSRSHFDDKAESAFLLGELYNFQSRKPERAVAQYLDVERQYSYTRFGPKAAYAAAWTLDRMNRPGASDSAFARVAARYPRSTFGQAARDTLLARHGAQLDSLLRLGERDTTNQPLPKPPEAVADSMAQAAFADSVRRVAVRDSVRADSLRIELNRQTRADSVARAAAASRHAGPDSVGHTNPPPARGGSSITPAVAPVPADSAARHQQRQQGQHPPGKSPDGGAPPGTQPPGGSATPTPPSPSPPPLQPPARTPAPGDSVIPPADSTGRGDRGAAPGVPGKL